MYSTKSLTRSFNISADTLRYYEKLGLLHEAKRQENGYRLYPSNTPKRLRFIQQSQQVGFKLKEIHMLLELDDDPSSMCEDVSTFIEQKRQQVHQQVRHLHDIEDVLAQLLASCSGDDGPTERCPIINSFYNGNLPKIEQSQKKATSVVHIS